MNLVDTLRKKIDVLSDGEFVPGLRAILMHIETAFRHLTRGQETDDDTAFTDAIYRTNQAFEGSIKEAYRVLADKNPERKSPFEIESYIEQNNVFRSRVLRQLSTYRTEWRNPSTHDYKLDFDESEAFLAIVSVSAFACLLLDQMAERLAFTKTQAETDAQRANVQVNLAKDVNSDLLGRVTELLERFRAAYLQSEGASVWVAESQVIGSLHGFLTSAAPELEVQTEAILVAGRPFRADLIVTHLGDRVLVEIKRRLIRKNYENIIGQVEHSLLISGIKNGVLLFLSDSPAEVKRTDLQFNTFGVRLVVLSS